MGLIENEIEFVVVLDVCLNDVILMRSFNSVGRALIEKKFGKSLNVLEVSIMKLL